MTALAPILQAFFSDRLQKQRGASSHTIASYRDAFCILLDFVEKQIGKAPTELFLADLDVSLIGDFLDHLEDKRNNSARTRNTRLAAIRSFFRYAATREPEHLALIQRVLAIPQKRYDRNIVTFLTNAEVNAILSVPDRTNWFGRRDYTILLLAVQTGLRVSELIGLRPIDLVLGKGQYLRCLGKGRKERVTPLTRKTVVALRAWIQECKTRPDANLFSSRRGGALSRDAVEKLVSKHTMQAQKTCLSLKSKRVTPHVLRHTCAVHLLQGGVDCSTIALWLGHESVDTTQVYLSADLSIKEKALSRMESPTLTNCRFQPDDALLAYLNSL